MSAIAGILGRIDDANRQALARMSHALSRRGPDGQGEWHSAPDASGWGCMLAHRRLAIFDDPASQPLHDPANHRALALDGSVVNYRQLSGAGAGEAQAVLNLLARDATDALRQFRGLFALAMWDDEKRRLLLARDALGQRPLYVCINPDISPERTWSLAFASELRAILASGLIRSPALNPIAVATMVWNGFVMSPHTMVRGVELLWPGEARWFDLAGRAIETAFYWSIPPAEKNPTIDEQPMRQALRETVRLHMASDRPVGVFLSGGIDSSSMANLALQHAQHPIDTFCLAMEEASLSEADAARQIAAAIGSNHHEITLTEQQFVSHLDSAIRSLDQPTYDALNQYHICRAVRDAGMKVAVSGIAGDAIFGGDITLQRLPRLQRLSAGTSWLPLSIRVGAAHLAARLLQKRSGDFSPQTRWSKLPDIARAGTDLLALYQLNYALFRPDFHRELLADPVAEQVWYGLSQQMRQWLGRQIEGHTPASAAAILETRCFAGERLVRDADTVSSSLGIEMRSPLCDPRILETLNRLDESRKFHPVGNKPLLRKYGLEGLDPRLFNRPKSGFVLPFEQWIRRHLGQVMDRTMRDPQAIAAAGLRPEPVRRLWEAYQQGASALYWNRPWSIYVLIRWCQEHQVHA